MAVASAIIAIVGTGASIQQQRVASRKQKKSEALNRRQAELENAREIRQGIALGRQQQASLIASGQAGVQTSGQAGGLAGAQTQLASNIQFATQKADVNRQSNRLISQANRNLSRASIAQAIGGAPVAFGADPSEAFKKGQGFSKLFGGTA